MLPTDDELARRQRRTAWWLFVARRKSGRTLGDVAQHLGLKAATSVGDFERGVTFPSLRQLTVLAALYEVDLRLFTDPPLTDEERLVDSAIGAAVLVREDSEREDQQRRVAEGGRCYERRTGS
jgi:transcriptional regulator with XRE-family HTH domain